MRTLTNILNTIVSARDTNMVSNEAIEIPGLESDEVPVDVLHALVNSVVIDAMDDSGTMLQGLSAVIQQVNFDELNTSATITSPDWIMGMHALINEEFMKTANQAMLFLIDDGIKEDAIDMLNDACVDYKINVTEEGIEYENDVNVKVEVTSVKQAMEVIATKCCVNEEALAELATLVSENAGSKHIDSMKELLNIITATYNAIVSIYVSEVGSSLKEVVE